MVEVVEMGEVDAKRMEAPVRINVLVRDGGMARGRAERLLRSVEALKPCCTGREENCFVSCCPVEGESSYFSGGDGLESPSANANGLAGPAEASAGNHGWWWC